MALKLEITVLFGMPRDLRDSHTSLVLPIVSESLSLKKACFFEAINFNASYFDFLYTSVSTWDLSFLIFVKSLFLRFNFSNTSPSNYF